MQWISVKDQLPPQAGYYLVWVVDEEYEGFVRYTTYFNVSKTWEVETKEYDIKVTHWMDLPEGPEDV